MRFQQIMLDISYPLSVALLLVVAVTMFLRHLHRQAPIFFAYVVFDTVALAAIYALILFNENRRAWYGAWAEEAVCILLGVAILAEIFNRMFASYAGIRRFAKVVLLWSAVVLVAIGAFLAAFVHHVAFSVPILTAFLVLDRSLRFVQLGLILSLFALSRYLHLRWKSFVFGIALGFGFNALMLLAAWTVRIYYGQLVAGPVNVLEGVSYSASALIWVFYVLQREVAHIPIVSLPSHELEKWDRALTQLLRRSATPPISATTK